MKHLPIARHPAAPATADPEIPTYEQLVADPEIAALLDFEPVPRRNRKQGGWSPDMQRIFIARLARHGSPNKACDEVGMYRSGIDKVAKCPGAESFRDAWAAAVALAERRRADWVVAGYASVVEIKLPFVDHRRRTGRARDDDDGDDGDYGGYGGDDAPAAPNMVRNEYGDWEDAESYRRRGEEAKDSISSKLQRCRRLYLREIAASPAHRAAFEILTRLPIDWDKAARLEPQDDEPWRAPNLRTPEMLLTAENGWMGDMVHGEDKIAELRQAMDAYREEKGLAPIDWDKGEGSDD